jgi:hypothetical protein
MSLTPTLNGYRPRHPQASDTPRRRGVAAPLADFVWSAQVRIPDCSTP